jgi:hypothetical protein
MLPKTCRVIVWIDRSGYLSACASYELKTKGQNLRSRGFQPLIHFRAPLRRLQCGWWPLYQYALGRIVRLYDC